MRRLFPDNNFVAPFLNPGMRLCIAEAPGEVESEVGEPLVGPSGSWLRGRLDPETGRHTGGLYKRAGVRDEDVSRLNCLQCRPPDNVFPTDPDARRYISKEDADAAIAHCYRAHVIPVLRGRNWSRIDILGDKALRIIAQKDGGIMRWRGSPLAIPEIGHDKPIAVPTIHPAAIARDQRYIPAVISDLKKSLIQPPEHYVLTPSLEQVRAFDAKVFAFDIECDRTTGKITMIGLCAKPFEAMCVPFGGAYEPEIKRIFKAAAEVIGHNAIQFDLPILREQGIVHKTVTVWDTMLMQHLLQPDLPHDLGFLGSIFSNKSAWKHLAEENEPLYNCRDVDVTFQCWKQLQPLLKAERLMDLYQKVQVPLARICYTMHEIGIRVDATRIGAVREKIKKEMSDEEAYLPPELRTQTITVRKRSPAPPGTLGKSGKPLKYRLVDTTESVVPWRSPDTITNYLYSSLGLPVQLHVKSQRVTSDKTALDKLYRRTKRRDILALQKLRRLDELETTFCKEEILGVERLHPHFNVHGTNSGRLSSSDPNLQNIPESARYIYVPSHPDWRFLEVDYSSIENRLTAWFANDSEKLQRWAIDPKFNEHKWTASLFFSIPYEQVEKDNDRDAPYGRAKRINHGRNYGMGPQKIANTYDMDLSDVRELCKKWDAVNPKVLSWQIATAAKAKQDGFLVTPFGRKRWFYTDSYYTESLSFLPQSTAADVIFRAMLGLMYERIGLKEEDLQGVVSILTPLPSPVRLILQVHDSLLFELPGSMVDEVVAEIRRVMEQPWPELAGLSIPVEIKLGEPGASWAELKKL